MFLFVTRHLGFLKFVPGLALFFDALLKLWTFLTKPDLLNWIDEIEKEVLTWEGTNSSIHKYGGLQLNYYGKEIGHIHSNGLLDMLVSRKIKTQLMKDERVMDHHAFTKSGWISFYIKTDDDRAYALGLLTIKLPIK